MRKAIRIFIVAVIVFFTGIYQDDCLAQMTSSPYSIFGAGQIEDNGFGVSKAMGGTGIGLSSMYSLNNANPASYAGIDTLTFLFEVGAFGKYTHYKTSNTTQDLFDGNLRYLAMGFRITNWWSASLGIVPYSTVGYKIESPGNVEGDISSFVKTYAGSGGIDQFYLSNSFRIFKDLSLGINTSYVFGSISQNESLSAGGSFEGYDIGKISYIHSLYLDYGLQYSIHFGKWKGTLGLIYGNKKNLNTTTDFYLAYNNDTVDLKGESDDFVIPAKYGIGIGIEKGKFLRIAFDYERRDWSVSNFSNPLIDTRNSERFSAGIEYIPFKSYRDPFYKRLGYRLGAFYDKPYLLIDGEPINSRAVSFGVGIPVKNALSMINLSFEWGMNGTLNKGLIQENYFLFNLNLSLRDLWFQKPKYD